MALPDLTALSLFRRLRTPVPAFLPGYAGTSAGGVPSHHEDDGLGETLQIFFTKVKLFRAGEKPSRRDCSHCAVALYFARLVHHRESRNISHSSTAKCHRLVATGEASVQLSGSIPNHSAIKEELDTRFRASLLAYFLRRTGNHQEAEDLTQETFVRLIGSNSFEKAEEAPAFVFRVASNLLRDRARSATRLKRFPTLPIDTVGGDEFGLKLVEDIDPERVLIARESLTQVLACLDELGERTKNMFILFRLEGMKQKGIAAFYGVSASTVEKHVMAAVLHLTKRFGPL